VDKVDCSNLKAVLESRCEYYEARLEELRTLIEQEGVTIENLSKRRETALQGLAVDIGTDLSQMAKVSLQLQGAPYFGKMLTDFQWCLKDVLNALRLYSGAERGNFV
jgi:hypothetical protein